MSGATHGISSLGPFFFPPKDFYYCSIIYLFIYLFVLNVSSRTRINGRRVREPRIHTKIHNILQFCGTLGGVGLLIFTRMRVFRVKQTSPLHLSRSRSFPKIQLALQTFKLRLETRSRALIDKPKNYTFEYNTSPETFTTKQCFSIVFVPGVNENDVRIIITF